MKKYRLREAILLSKQLGRSLTDEELKQFEVREQKKEIKIQFDYLHGPLWKDELDPETNKWLTGISCIDNDKAIQELNDEAQRMYESLYSFEKGSGCQFENQRFAEIKMQLLDITRSLIKRLEEINDGSYTVVDNTQLFLN